MLSVSKILNSDQQNRNNELNQAEEGNENEEEKLREEREEGKNRQCEIMKRILPKDDEEKGCKFCNKALCECWKSAELYSIYAKNRCYMAYDIHYKDREE